jgi:catechol 2,3-dioxygenase
VHLSVGDTGTARAFYVDRLGFEVVADLGGNALFVSAGGYHHHMAMNVWNSRNAGRRRFTLGLGLVRLDLPSDDHVGELDERLRHHGIDTRHDGSALRFEDPWGNSLEVAPSAG